MFQLRSRYVALAPIAALALVLSGCSGLASDSAGEEETSSSSSSETSSEAGSTEETSSEGSSSTSAALDFTGTLLDGSAFQGESLTGQPAVLWFWAPWCPKCIGQIGDVTSLAKTYGDDVQFLAVGGLDTAEEITELTDDIPYVTHLVDEEGSVWKHFGVTAQSTFEVIDADGEIVSSGYLSADELQNLVSDLAG